MPDPPQGESLATILYRVTSIEADFARFKEQLKAYDTTRENDLKLERINDTVTRMEVELGTVRQNLEDMNTRIFAKEYESKQRDSEASTAQDKLQIKVLVGILTTIIGIIGTLLIFYITHR